MNPIKEFSFDQVDPDVKTDDYFEKPNDLIKTKKIASPHNINKDLVHLAAFTSHRNTNRSSQNRYKQPKAPSPNKLTETITQARKYLSIMTDEN